MDLRNRDVGNDVGHVVDRDHAILAEIQRRGVITVRHELRWARITTVALAVVAAFVALYTGDLVALLGAFGFGTFAAALVPVVAVGLNWKRGTAAAASVAIGSSLLINFSVKIFGWTMPWGIDVGAASMAVSLFLYLSISLLSRPDEMDPRVGAVMDL